MVRLEAAVGVLVLLVSVYTLVRLAATPGGEVRALPKLAWMLLIVLFPGLGLLGYLALGRPAVDRFLGRPAESGIAERGAATPETDEEFRRRVRERAEEQRRRARGEPDPDQGQ